MIGTVQRFLRPKTLDELLTTLAALQGPRYLLAGGTDILVKAKDGKVAPGAWIDVWQLDELRGVSAHDDRIELGANTTMADVERSELLRADARALWDACREAGAVQIRNRATLAGNTANASPAGDSIPALYSLGATVVLRSVRGERRVAIEALLTGPGRSVIAPDEAIVRFSLPRVPGQVGAFQRLGQRQAQAISKLSVAATASLGPGLRVQAIRLALGAVAPTVIRAPKVEALLTGRALEPGLIAEAGELVTRQITPITDVRSTKDYRQEMTGVVLRRVLGALVDRSS